MNHPSLGQRFRANYEGYYEKGESEWRDSGAVGKARNIISLCSAVRHDALLEIGAGDGAILKRLSDASFARELYALEISASGLEAIKKRDIPRLVACNLFDGETVPYEDNRFDIAILSHVVEHLEYPRQLIYEASRVASYVFVEVPLEDTVRLRHDFVFDRVGHINVYSSKTIRWLVQSCGLRVLRQLTTNAALESYEFQNGKRGWCHFWLKEWMLRLAPGMARWLFSYHSALLCVKEPCPPSSKVMQEAEKQ